jgi:3-dehydroquinate dehydratase
MKMSKIDIFPFKIISNSILVLIIHLKSIDENNIGEVEKETLEIVKKTVSALESTIRDFNRSSSDSPDSKIERYRDLHLLLSEWVHDFEERPEDEGYHERVERIRQFIDICQVLE